MWASLQVPRKENHWVADDDAEDMGDYEGRQAECDRADALDDLAS